MRVLVIVIFFSFAAQNTLHAQETNSDLLFGLADLRAKLLNKEKDNLSFIDSLHIHWKPISHLSIKEKTEILYLIGFYHGALSISKKKLSNIQRLKTLGFDIAAYDRRILKYIDNCLHTISIMYEGYIDHQKPYKLSIDSNFQKIIKFYQIQNGDLVADIGAGIGTDTWVLSQLYPKSQFIVTELWGTYDIYLKDRFLGVANTGFKMAKKKHTNLEGHNVDRILVQNTFHHFEAKDLMLQSIKKSLSPSGVVLLKEATYDLVKNEFCHLSMTLASIKEYWLKNGFQLVDELIINQTHYLKFKVAK